MKEIASIVEQDYRPIKSRIERSIVAYILRKKLANRPVVLRFDADDVRPMSDAENPIELRPPSLSTLLGMMRDPDFYFPEAYVKGKWYCASGDILRLTDQLYTKNTKTGQLRANYAARGFYMGIPNLLKHIYKHYINISALREVKAHYNNDPDFYEQVIGPKMVYSCAFFASPNDDLQTAQSNKLETTFARLNLTASENTKILDIGCGWGSFIFHSAAKHKGQFDGISISSSQIGWAKNAKASLSESVQKRVNFFCEDYKGYLANTENHYDGIVSIGMLEHVGQREYKAYFREIFRLLKPGHRAVVHTITRRVAGITNPWIEKYIFPGGYIPLISEVIRGIESTDLRLVACHRHAGENYQRTLKLWEENLLKNAETCLKILKDNLPVDKTGFNVRKTYRIWLFYLAICQWAFAPKEHSFDVTQFVVQKPHEYNI